jgi:hypothetical protein
MSNDLPAKRPPDSQILLYQTEDGRSRIEVRLEGETVWLTQAGLAELFQTSVPNISMHLRNLFQEGELAPDSVVKNYLTTAADGKNYQTRHFNLEAIIAVGYRVRSHRGTQFRRWATEHLREYLVKGFTMDDERLKEGRDIGADYFDELIERIRDIRASEKRFYQKIRDIYKLATDYDPQAEATLEFFKVVQNKLHWAIAGRTAAEIIAERADAAKPNMGLTAWKGAKVRRTDVTVAKNYLNENEIRQLNRFVTMYLDYAETQAEQRRPLYMKDWREKLDAFLSFNQKEILQDAGRVSMEIAQRLALTEYEKFQQRRLADEAASSVDPPAGRRDDFDSAAKLIETTKKPDRANKRKRKPSQ